MSENEYQVFGLNTAQVSIIYGVLLALFAVSMIKPETHLFQTSLADFKAMIFRDMVKGKRKNLKTRNQKREP